MSIPSVGVSAAHNEWIIELEELYDSGERATIRQTVTTQSEDKVREMVADMKRKWGTSKHSLSVYRLVHYEDTCPRSK